MNFGNLRHRVDIISQEATQDNTGAINYEDVVIATVWAHIAPLSVRSFIAAASTNSQVTATCTMRYRDMKPTYKIKHGDDEYDIVGILPDNRSGKEYLTITIKRIDS